MDQRRAILVAALILGAFVAGLSAVGTHKLGPISIIGLPIGLWVSFRAGTALTKRPAALDPSSITVAWFLIGSVVALFVSIGLFILVGGVFTEKMVLLSTLVLLILVPVALALGLLDLGKSLLKNYGKSDDKT